MEKNEMETHDFMNVESFSQLPFIRPAPVREKGIRLFGKEFGGTNTATADDSGSRDGSPTEDNQNKECENEESSRKFECHYCFRNFPTSQALGGHQNAHKRERQQAKRAHLQSAASMSHGGYYSAAYNRYGVAPPPPPLSYHHSWNNNTSSTNSYGTAMPRFYAGTHHPTVNGSPLGLWRIPAVQNQSMINFDRSVHHQPLPSFLSDEMKHKPSVVGESSNSRTRFVYDGNPSAQDQVSLDLHL